MAGKTEAFLAIGLSESKAKETLKNSVLADKLFAIIEEVRICTKYEYLIIPD